VALLFYTLQDAASRDRLHGTTFLQIHGILGSWMVLRGFNGGNAADVACFLLGGITMLLKGYRVWKLKQMEIEADQN